jgi:hypothetical protein
MSHSNGSAKIPDRFVTFWTDETGKKLRNLRQLKGGPCLHGGLLTSNRPPKMSLRI